MSLIAQVTDEEEIRELVNNGKATFYIGFDPTADSLHVGHFMALCLMKRLQMAGNQPIALIGGGTGMIGDPSGRTDMRTMMTTETIAAQLRLLQKADGAVHRVRRGQGHDGQQRRLAAEAQLYRAAAGGGRLLLREQHAAGRVLQAADGEGPELPGVQLHDHAVLRLLSTCSSTYGCNMQFGGDDQWSNMLGGTELIRRKLGKDAHAMTITLLLNSEGKKMGKTASGAVWLDPNKTSPFDFYQYWRNVGDADVLKCIRMLTFLPLEQIDAMDAWEGSQLNQAKEILAYELTKLVHGEEEAEKAQEAARALFGWQRQQSRICLPPSCRQSPVYRMARSAPSSLLVACGLCCLQRRGPASDSAGRRSCQRSRR